MPNSFLNARAGLSALAVVAFAPVATAAEPTRVRINATTNDAILEAHRCGDRYAERKWSTDTPSFEVAEAAVETCRSHLQFFERVVRDDLVKQGFEGERLERAQAQLVAQIEGEVRSRARKRVDAFRAVKPSR